MDVDIVRLWVSPNIIPPSPERFPNRSSPGNAKKCLVCFLIPLEDGLLPTSRNEDELFGERKARDLG